MLHTHDLYVLLYPSDTVAPSALARAGHSVVTWGDYMVIYGGYRFPTGDAPEGVGGANETEELQLFRYHFASRQLEVLNSSSESQPEPRYGHTAVVYNVRRHVCSCIFMNAL